MENWSNSDWQSHFDRNEKNPTKISERIIPSWYLLEGENRKKIKSYILDKYGSEAEDIYDMKLRHSEEYREINKKQDNLEKRLSEVEIPQSVKINTRGRDWGICGDDKTCDSQDEHKWIDGLPDFHNDGDHPCNTGPGGEIPEISYSCGASKFGSASNCKHRVTCWVQEVVIG